MTFSLSRFVVHLWWFTSIFFVVVPSPFCGGYVPLFFSVALLLSFVCTGSTGGCFSEVEGMKAEKGEAATTNSATKERHREGEESRRHKESEGRSRHHHTREREGGEEPPQRKRGGEEKEPPPPKRRNGWLSLSLVVASLPCHYMVDTFSLSLFCGGFPLSYSLIYGCSFRSFLRWFRSLLLFAVVLCFSLLSLFLLRGSSLSFLRLWLSFPLSIFAVVGFPSFFSVVLSFLSLFFVVVFFVFFV